MAYKDLSVIIVNWNTGALLRDSIESIYHETKKHLLEIIVVDNASSDDSVALVEKEFKEVIIIINSENLGFAKGNNIGVKAARGEFVILLNPDTKVLDGALDSICDFLKSADKNVGALGPTLLNRDGSFQREQGMRFPTLLTTFAQYFFFSHIFRAQGIFMNRKLDKTADVDWICGACLASPRKIYKEIGGMDEEYFLYAEDMDFCFRLREKGYRSVFLPGAKIMHISKQSTSKQGEVVAKYQIESLKNFYRSKHVAWKYHIFKDILFGGIAIRILVLYIKTLFNGSPELSEKLRSMRLLLRYVYV